MDGPPDLSCCRPVVGSPLFARAWDTTVTVSTPSAVVNALTEGKKVTARAAIKVEAMKIRLIDTDPVLSVQIAMTTATRGYAIRTPRFGRIPRTTRTLRRRKARPATYDVR